MSYLSSGELVQLEELSSMREILIQNGWTWVTAACTMIFSLMHWPCSTTCLTIKKETESWKWTALAVLLPTISGMIVCMCINFVGFLVGE